MVLIPSAAAGGGCHAVGDSSVARAEGNNVTVDIGKCMFTPTVVYIEEGTTVTWDNFDPVPHTVTGVALSLHGDEYIEASDEPVSTTFDEAGVFPYYCVLHPGMAAAVVVGDIDAQAAAADEATAAIAPGPDEDGYNRLAAQRGAEDTSTGMPGWTPYAAGVVTALAVLGLGVMWRRRHPDIGTPQEQHSPAGP
jgi:plastocyanin